MCNSLRYFCCSLLSFVLFFLLFDILIDSLGRWGGGGCETLMRIWRVQYMEFGFECNEYIGGFGSFGNILEAMCVLDGCEV